MLSLLTTSLAAYAPATRMAAMASLRVSPRSLVTAQMPPLPMHLEDLKESLESGEAVLFDVREPNEHAMGMLADAVAAPLSELQQGMCPRADKSTLTYLHCAAGIRVYPAADALQQLGFERVVPLQEGYASLVQYGFEQK